MSTEEAGFLAAICADPEDDTARLVFADWLQERGEDHRAAFIRAGVALERAPGCPGHVTELGRCPCARCELGREVDRLHGSPGAVRWRRLPWGASARIDFRRGFLFSLRATTAAFLEHAEALFRGHPITSVRLIDRDPDAGASSGDCYWHCAYEGDRLAFGSDLPRRLFVRLERWGTLDHRHEVVRYGARAEAHDDLSRACVAYGRERAGLTRSRMGGVESWAS